MISRCVAVVLWIALAMIGFAGCSKESVIHHAVENSELEKVSTLLKSRPDLISSRDKHDRTPLFYADGKEMAELLLTNKAVANTTNNAGETPLFWAAWRGRADVVELLLARGADAKISPRIGSPLHVAMVFRNTNAARITELLLAHGADVNARDYVHNETPLHWAASRGLKAAAELLLANKADVNAKDNEGKTPLDLAATNHHPRLVELLRQHGSNE